MRNVLDAIAREMNVAAVVVNAHGVALYHQTDADAETGWLPVPDSILDRQGVTGGTLMGYDTADSIRDATPREHMDSINAGETGVITVEINGEDVRCYVQN